MNKKELIGVIAWVCLMVAIITWGFIRLNQIGRGEIIQISESQMQ